MQVVVQVQDTQCRTFVFSFLYQALHIYSSTYRSIDHVFKDGNKVADKPAAYDRTSSELCIFETSSHVPAKFSRICKTDL